MNQNVVVENRQEVKLWWKLIFRTVQYSAINYHSYLVYQMINKNLICIKYEK